MNHILRPNTASVPGVFFIEEGDLIALDDILQDQFKELKKLRRAEIAAAARKKKKELPSLYSDLRETRKQIGQSYEFKEISGFVQIGTTETQYASFRDAITQKACEAEIPRKFDAYYVAGKKSIGVTLDDFTFTRQIKISVTPPDLFGGKALIDLRQWAEAKQQPWMVNLWANWWVPCLAFLCFVGWMVNAAITISRNTLRQNHLREEANKILNTGINGTNRDQAIEALLRIQTGITKEPIEEPVSSVPLIVLAVLVILGLILWRRPMTAVGIGRGKGFIKWQQWWLWFIFKFIGVTIIGGLLLAGVRKWAWAGI